jgi:serine/threonine protein kinase
MNIHQFIFEKKIKEYDFLEKIRQTSTGSIYKCLSKKTGQIIAMNILTFFELTELEDVSREIAQLKGFRSKYLGQIYDSFMHNGKLFLSLEYFPAGSLLDMVVKHTTLS